MFWRSSGKIIAFHGDNHNTNFGGAGRKGTKQFVVQTEQTNATKHSWFKVLLFQCFHINAARVKKLKSSVHLWSFDTKKTLGCVITRCFFL
jgi:hypothetical protein